MFVGKRTGQAHSYKTWARIVSTLLTPGLIALERGTGGSAAPAAPPPPAPPPAASAPAPVAAPPPRAGAAASRGGPAAGSAARRRRRPTPGVPPSAISPEELSPEELAALQEKDLDVVKVTVDRREKSIQTYAGSASAYTQDDLDRTGVTSLRQLGNRSPYLEIGTQEGNTEIFIRGIGSSDNTELGDPAAATYFGGVYIPRPRGVGSMFYDLDRVEVNRGPAGNVARPQRDGRFAQLDPQSASPR